MRINVKPFRIFLSLSLLWLLLFQGEQPDYVNYVPLLVKETAFSNPLFKSTNTLKFQQNYQEAIEGYEVLLHRIDLDTSDSLFLLNQIAYCYLIENWDEKAIFWLKAAERIKDNNSNISEYAKADYYFNLSRYLYLDFQFEKARNKAHESLKIYKSIGLELHLKIAQLYNLLSLLHFENNNVTDSTSYYAKEASRIFHTSGELYPYSAENYYTLAGSSLINRAHERGEMYCHIALDILNRYPNNNKLLEARVWSMLGNMYKKQGDHAGRQKTGSGNTLQQELYLKADTFCFRKAIKLGKESGSPRVQQIYGDLIIHTTRYEDSTSFFTYLNELNELLKIQKDVYGKPDRLLGYYYDEKGPMDSVKYYYEKLLEDHNGGKDLEVHLVDEAHYCLRHYYRKKREFSLAKYYTVSRIKAYDCCPKAMDFFDPLVFDSLNTQKTFCLLKYADIARILWEEYQEYPSIETLELADHYFSLISKYYYSSILHADENAVLTYQVENGKAMFFIAYEVALEAWKRTGKDLWLDRAFKYMEQTKSNTLARNLRRTMGSEEKAISITNSIRSTQAKVNELRYKFKTSTALNKKEILLKWDKVQIKLTNLVDSLKRKHLEYDELIVHPIPSIKEIQASLTAKQAVVEYLAGENKIYGIYIDHENAFPFVVDSLEKVTLNIDKYMAVLSTDENIMEKDKMTFREAAKNLYQQLIEPFDSLTMERTEWTVIPDGPLEQLPFEAFIVNDIDETPNGSGHTRYLQFRTDIAYSPSWKLFYRSQENPFQNESLQSLAIWRDHNIFSNLVDSLQEMDLAPKNYHWKWWAKTNFQKYHQNYRMINIIQHAESNKTNRLDSKIKFGPGEKNWLFGFDILNYEFTTDLVVLAACQSAYGTIAQGEGTFSLTRSFLETGVPRVVSTLWNVKQRSTDQILIQFYKKLQEGHTPVTALNDAKRNYLLQQEPPYDFPAYWAGVIITH